MQYRTAPTEAHPIHPRSHVPGRVKLGIKLGLAGLGFLTLTNLLGYVATRYELKSETPEQVNRSFYA